MTLVGAVKRDKAFLPLEFKQKKALGLYETNFLFRQSTVLVSYQSKKEKNVILLSSMHNDASVDETKEKKKPDIVLKYNATKGGVDALDQMAHSFTTKRKTKRWPLVYLFNLLDLSTICASIVYKLKYPEDMFSKADNRQMFNIQIGGQLALPHIKRRLAVRTLSITLRNHIQIVTAALEPEAPAAKKRSAPRDD